MTERGPRGELAIPLPGRSAFGEALRRWRRARDLTQKHLAAALHISSAYAGMLETGRRRPAPDVLATLKRLGFDGPETQRAQAKEKCALKRTIASFDDGSIFVDEEDRPIGAVGAR